MTNTNTTPTPEPNAQERKDLPGGVNLEENDRLNHATEIAAIQSEIRALTGQALDNTIPGRRNPRRLWLTHRPAATPGRTAAINLPLTAKIAENFIEPIAGHLFAATREAPALKNIQTTIRNRFREILAARRNQGRAPTDRVSEPIVIGRALLDAVYEQIKETDLESLALNIVLQLPVPRRSHRAYSHYNQIRNHYLDAGGHHLTNEGLKLLERLRQGNANPGKVLLAFSAALDSQFYDPEVPTTDLDPVDPLPGGVPRLKLNTVLGLPLGGIPERELSRKYQSVAEAYEAYAAFPQDQLVYSQPPPVTGAGITDESAYRRSMDKYDNAQSSVLSIRDSLEGLVRYYFPAYTRVGAGPLPAPVHTVPPNLVPFLQVAVTPAATPATYVKTQIDEVLNALQPCGTPPSVPRSLQVKEILKNAFGGTLSTAAEYKANSEKGDNEQGLTGTDACNKILAEYTRRVGGVDENTAKKALGSLTGRVRVAEQMLREDREQQSGVAPAWDVKDQRKEFNKMHKDANRIWNTSYPTELFLRELNRRECIGLPQPKHPMSEANSLDALQTRYYTLWYATNILPADDPRHLPLNSVIAEELVSLRKAIVERHLRNISNVLARKGIDKLKKEDVEKMGLRGANIDDLPFDEIQDRLFQMLNEKKLEPSMQEKADAKLNQAIRPLKKREDVRAKWRGRYKSAAKGTGKATLWTLSRPFHWARGEGYALNPFTWPARIVKGTYNTIAPRAAGFWNHLMAKDKTLFN